jgi:transcriptional regulator with XRE-family HTH domain
MGWAMPRVASRIRELRAVLWARQGAEYSVRAAAERAGIPARTWAAYERGEVMPPGDVAVKIARVLGVSVEELELTRIDETGEGEGPAHDTPEPGS